MWRTTGAAMITALSLAGAASAQETIEEMASEAETASVQEAIGRINCTAQEVEKESATLFEVDDAECEIGQYDIKLDADFNIISMTRDQ